MALSIETLAVAKKYTDDSIAGGGAIKGKNCVITSITSITGGHRVTFQWTLDNGTVQTNTMDVMDGADGQDGATGATGPAGVGIKKIEKTGTSGLVDTYTITYTNDQTQTYEVTNGANGQDGQDGQDGEGVPTGGSQGQVLAKKSATDYDTEWVTPSAGATIDSELSTTSENPVQNKVITAALGNKVDAVPGKGLSTEDFSSEDKTKLSGIASGAEVNVQSDWDQSNNNADDFIKNKPTLGTAAAKDSTNAVTENSTDLVESGAVHTAIDNAVKALDVSDSAVAGSYVTQVTETDGKISVTREAADAAPAENSNKLVKSGGVYAGLAGKADKVSGATNGDFAGLDANGNLTDSGKKASDFATPTDIQNVYKANGVLGAKNLIYVEDFTLIKSSARTKSLTTEDFGNDIPKTQVTLSFEVSDSNLTVNGEFRAYAPLVSGVRELLGGVPYMADGTYSFSFDATKLDQLYIFINNEDETTATCKIGNVMIRFANDSDATYQPYAKTNKQLTEDKVEQAEVNDIVNVYGAKNILRYPYYQTTRADSGMTITDNGDGSITISGTATARVVFRFADNSQVPAFTPPVGTYKLVVSGNSAGLYINFDAYNNITWVKTLATIHDNGISASFDVDYNGYDKVTGYIDIPSGTAITTPITVKPMILLASIQDDTWVPYVPTNAELLSADTNAVLGAHNLVDVSIDRASLYGVDFTNEGDNKIKLNGTCNTATANGVYKMHLKPGTYIASIQVLSGSHNTAKTLWIERKTGTTAINPDITITTETYKERQFTVSTEGDYEIQIGIARDDVFSNLVLGYMIRLASDPSIAYTPYAMTNRELTTSATTNAKNISTINKGTLDIDAIELTANTPKKVISSYGVYLITFNHGGGAPGGLYLVQVHATDVNGMQVAVIKESTDRTVSFDLTVVNQLTVTASGNGRMRIIKLDASNY